MSTVYEKITKRIVDAIEASNTLPWQKTWHTKDGMPRNLNTGHAYRGINVFVLAMQGYESPFWLTLNQANKFGGHVKADEKSTPVVFWKWPNKEDRSLAEDEGRNVFPFAKSWNVFNIAQTEGVSHKRLDERAAQTVAPQVDVIEGAENIVKGWKDACRISHDFERAFYNPLIDSIGMPKPEAFESGEAYYCTLFHEITHATGHQKRCKRFPEDEGGACFGSSSYSREELVAEMGASFLAAESGIDMEAFIDNSASYVAGWLKRLKGDSKLVLTAAGQAQKAADHVLNRKFKAA